MSEGTGLGYGMVQRRSLHQYGGMSRAGREVVEGALTESEKVVGGVAIIWLWSIEYC